RPNCAVLDRLKTSHRNSRPARSVMGKSRWIAKLNTLVCGPRRMLRPAFPYCPGVCSAKALVPAGLMARHAALVEAQNQQFTLPTICGVPITLGTACCVPNGSIELPIAPPDVTVNGFPSAKV